MLFRRPLVVNKYEFPLGLLTITLLIMYLISRNYIEVVSSISLIMAVIFSFFWGFYNLYALITLAFMMTEQCGMIFPAVINIFSISITIADFSSLFIIEMVIIILIRIKKISLKFDYGYLILLWIPIILISMINTYLNYGQNIILGIFTQRNILLYICYFPIVQAFSCNLLSIDTLKKIILRISKIYIVLYLIQHVLYTYGGFIFLNVSITERVGIRLNYHPFILGIALMIYVEKYIKNRLRFNDIITVLGIIYIIVFICQLRMFSLGLGLASFACMMLCRSSRLRISLGIIPIMIILVIIFNSQINNFIIYTKKDFAGSENSSYVARLYEKDYFSKQLKGSELFGLGVLNNNSGRNGDITGSSSNYYLNDLGSYEMKYYYGYVGYFLLIVLLILMLYKSLVLMKYGMSYFVAIYAAFIVIISPTILPFYNKPIFTLIMLVLSDTHAYHNRYRICV